MCFRRCRIVFKIVRSILVRVLFTVLSLVCIWEVVDSHKNHAYWWLTFLLIPLLIESVYTLIQRRGHEYRWVCPSTLCFLIATTPSIWLLELNMLERRITKVHLEELHSEERGATSNHTWGFHFPAHISRSTQVTTMEQFQLIMAVIGRWILPKGSLDRDALSQMLLTYVGIMADNIEFFSNFKETEVNTDRPLTVGLLTLWTISILQFSFVFGSVKHREWRLTPTSEEEAEREDPLHHSVIHVCLSSDLWAMTIMVIMMDIPFFTFRLLLIFYCGVINHTMFFFTVKNAIVTLLQSYRIIALLVDRTKYRRRPEPHAIRTHRTLQTPQTLHDLQTIPQAPRTPPQSGVNKRTLHSSI